MPPVAAFCMKSRSPLDSDEAPAEAAVHVLLPALLPVMPLPALPLLVCAVAAMFKLQASTAALKAVSWRNVVLRIVESPKNPKLAGLSNRRATSPKGPGAVSVGFRHRFRRRPD